MSTATARSVNARTLIELVRSIDRGIGSARQSALSGENNFSRLLELAGPLVRLEHELYAIDESSRFEDGTLSEWNTDFREVEEEIIEAIRGDLLDVPVNRDWRPDGNAPDGGCEFKTGWAKVRVGKSLIPFRGRVEIDGVEVAYERSSVDGDVATYELSFA